MQFKNLLLVIMIGLFFSCKKKETIVEVEKEVIVYQEPGYKWKRNIYFDKNFSTTITNSRRLFDGLILFTTNNYNILYDSAQNKFSAVTQRYSYEKQVRPLITKEYYLEVNDYAINIYNTDKINGNVLGYINGLLLPKNIDSNFLAYDFKNNYLSGDLVGNSNKFVYPYFTKDNKSKYAIIKIKKEPTSSSFPDNAIVIDTFKTITNLNYVSTNRLTGVIGNNLFFTCGNNKNYIVNNDLDTIYINSNVYNCIFKVNNLYYSFCGGVALGGDTKLLSTSDEGLTWQIVSSGLNYQFQILNYVNVGDKLIAFYVGQMWEVIINNNTLAIKELSNDGLDNKLINAITMSNGRVFVGTNNGVFERPFSEFIDYK